MESSEQIDPQWSILVHSMVHTYYSSSTNPKIYMPRLKGKQTQVCAQSESYHLIEMYIQITSIYIIVSDS